MPELTGTFAWLGRHPERIDALTAALNLDMVGADQAQCGSTFLLEHPPCFADIKRFGDERRQPEKASCRRRASQTPVETEISSDDISFASRNHETAAVFHAVR
jgi:hypothetical protein